MALPTPTDAQPYCRVSALEGGVLKMPTSFACKDAPSDEILACPCLGFLLVHSGTGHKFVFDLGIPRNWRDWPPAAVNYLKEHPELVVIDEDVLEALAKGGTSPSEIDTIGISHAHFDHVGDPSQFTKSRFVVGGGTEELLINGHPQNATSMFPSEAFPKDRTTFLHPDQWKPIGPFPRALDFFGDGSLYIVDSPGHLPGHINILARTSANGGWIYLAGDSVHHWDILKGKAEVAVGHPVLGHSFCLHQNKEAALETIDRIRQLMKIPRVRVLLAHDEPWYKENKGGDAFWPGTIQSL